MREGRNRTHRRSSPHTAHCARTPLRTHRHTDILTRSPTHPPTHSTHTHAPYTGAPRTVRTRSPPCTNWRGRLPRSGTTSNRSQATRSRIRLSICFIGHVVHARICCLPHPSVVCMCAYAHAVALSLPVHVRLWRVYVYLWGCFNAFSVGFSPFRLLYKVFGYGIGLLYVTALPLWALFAPTIPVCARLSRATYYLDRASAVVCCTLFSSILLNSMSFFSFFGLIWFVPVDRASSFSLFCLSVRMRILYNADI